MNKQIYHSFKAIKKEGKKAFALLIDPDNVSKRETLLLAERAAAAKVDYLLVGGSLSVSGYHAECIAHLKQHCSIPVILFPGNAAQLSNHADALLYLSLISGRNADLLIGQHVVSAPLVKQSGLEIIPTGYILIDGGAPTSVSYISNTTPIPSDKKDIALCTALAGEMLGMQLIFMDAGSGAARAISTEMIACVSKTVSVPLIIGGGITGPEKAYENCRSGADVIVVGNAIEKDISLISEMTAAVHSVSVYT